MKAIRGVHLKTLLFVLVFAFVGVYLLFSSFAAETFPTSRDKYEWPFSQKSIWNMPIGSGAKYAPSGLQTTNAWHQRVTIDEENIAQDPSAPLKTLTVTDGSREGNGMSVRVPSDMTANGSLNNCSTFLMQDNKRIIQGQPLLLAKGGNPSWKWTIGGIIDLKSDGYFGCHGGSRLSGIGGSIRKGELTSSEPIRHALKINVFCKRFCSQHSNGFRWPADRADGGYNNPSAENYYGGTVPEMRMGALLALKPGTDTSYLTSPKLKKFAKAFTDYGAYVVDNTAWDVYGIVGDKYAKDEILKTDLSGDTDDKEYHRQFQRLITQLMVVDNNSPASIGGGGTPRAPLAPCFIDDTNCTNSPAPTPSPEPSPAPSDPPTADTKYLYKDSSFTQGVNISASSEANGTFAAAKAIDGDELSSNSRWISTSQDNQTLTLDLGSTKTINKVAYLFAGDTTKNYKVEVSLNNSTFTEIATGETDNQAFTLREHRVDPVDTRYVRLTGLTRWNQSYGHSVREMGVYTTTEKPATKVVTPLRINTGGSSYRDGAGNSWVADTYFDAGNGNSYSVTNEIANTSNQTLYQSERWCPASYNIPVTNKKYLVKLHFAEINPRSGSRVFGMQAENKSLFTGYNISQTVGDYKADVKQYEVDVTDGELTITFQPDSGCPKISGIELLDAADVSLDRTAPVIEITNPAAQSKLTGNATLSAKATDNVAIAAVEFQIGGKKLPASGTSTYSAQLDTTTMTNGTYLLTAEAKDTSGNISKKSIDVDIDNAVTDTQPPTAPGNLRTSSVVFDRVSLVWDVSTDNVGVMHYEIHRNGALFATTSGTSYDDRYVTQNTSYSYTVIAVDSSGNKSNKSNSINAAVPVSPDTQPPTVPANLVAAQVQSSSVQLSWNASSDNTAVTGYYIYRENVLLASTTTLTFTDTNLQPSTSYTYGIRAYDAAKNLSQPATLKVTTPATTTADTTPPSTPAALTATAVKNNQVNLSWKNSTDDSGSVVYDIYRDGVLLVTTSRTSFGDGSVHPNTEYTYFVRAVDSSKNSSSASNYVVIAPKESRFKSR